MAALAIGVSRIKNQLPDPVYALLSGLNSATVGIIALAAVQLAEKAIKDKLSRILVIFGACAGLCYTALWYFPVLMVIGGVTSALWDLWLQRVCAGLINSFKKRRYDDQILVEENAAATSSETHMQDDKAASSTDGDATKGAEGQEVEASSSQKLDTHDEITSEKKPSDEEVKMNKKDLTDSKALDTRGHDIPMKVGIAIIILFFGK
jgi:hypothetical protein